MRKAVSSPLPTETKTSQQTNVCTDPKFRDFSNDFERPSALERFDTFIAGNTDTKTDARTSTPYYLTGLLVVAVLPLPVALIVTVLLAYRWRKHGAKVTCEYCQ